MVSQKRNESSQMVAAEEKGVCAAEGIPDLQVSEVRTEIAGTQGKR